IAPGPVRVDDRQIDPRLARAEPPGDLEPERFQGAGDDLLEAGPGWRLTVRVGRLVEGAALGEPEEGPQGPDPPGDGSAGVEVGALEVGEDLAAQPGPGDQHVEPALAAVAVERAEVHRDPAVGVPAVADADEDGIALVPLHAFEV